MKPSVVLLAVLILPVCCLAQRRVAGVTVEVVTINEQQEPVSSATIMLLKQADSSVSKSGISLGSGRVFLQAHPGNYILSVSAIGYRHFFSAPFEITDQADTLHLAPAQLVRDDQQLKAVTVLDSKKIIDRQFDKVVVNVENSITFTGSNVLDILGRSPGVIVDQNENIRLEGKSGVTILIDGKPLQLAGTDLANLLKGMSSTAVEKIEIISHPGAAYDASGSAGVINIVTKKSKASGTNGTITVSAGEGRYPKSSVGFSINHRKNKINTFASYTYSYLKRFSNPVLFRQFKTGNSVTGAYRQNDYITFPLHSQVARAGLDYTFSPRTTVGLSLNGLQNRFNEKGDNHSEVLDGQAARQSTFTTTNRSSDAWYNYAGNLHLRHAFDTTGREFTLDLDYAKYCNRTAQTFVNNYYLLDGSILRPTYILYGELPGRLAIRSISTNFTWPLGKGRKLDAGLKASDVQSDNDIRFYDRSSSVSVYDSTKSNHYLYRENINAGYVSLSGKDQKIQYQCGLRAEQTNLSGNQLINHQRTDSSYLQLFPSLTVLYSLSPHHDLTINANRRIDRPTYKQLNPFKFYIDPTTYVSGNPDLRPQETYNIELSHTLDQKLTSSLAYTLTKDNITEVLYPSETEKQVTVQTSKNLRRVRYYVLTESYQAQVTRWWNTVSQLIIYNGKYQGDLAGTPLDKSSTTFNVNSTNSFTLGKGYHAEASLEYRAGEVYGYYYIKPIWQVHTGVQKDILKGKGSLKLNCTDVFFTYVIRGSTNFSQYYESFTTKKETRIGTLSFSYRFGKSPASGSPGKNGGAEEEKSRASTGG